MINDEIFWVEAKTGHYQNYVNKYSNVSKILDLDLQHSIMVLTDLPYPSITGILSQTFNMNVISIENFENEIKSLFKNDVDEI